ARRDVEGVQDQKNVHEAGGEEERIAVLEGHAAHFLAQAVRQLDVARVGLVLRKPVDDAPVGGNAAEQLERTDRQVVERREVGERLVRVDQRGGPVGGDA